MTDKILKASTFETQGISYVAERVNLNSIIQQVLSSLKLIFEKHKLNVDYSSRGRLFGRCFPGDASNTIGNMDRRNQIAE